MSAASPTGAASHEENAPSPPTADLTEETPSDIAESTPKAVHLEEAELGAIGLDRLKEAWLEQAKYVKWLEMRGGDRGGPEPPHSNRENVLIMRLSAKEREIQILSNQINELKASQVAGPGSWKACPVDPAIHLVITRLRQELVDTKKKMSETHEELSAWKFTPDSVTGKRLMSKCRQLLQENEDIGKMISSGRLAKLESELAMQKTLCQAMKKNEAEMEEFAGELDTDMEGMQSTICFLQQQLKEAKDKMAVLEATRSQTNAPLEPQAAAEPDGLAENDSPTEAQPKDPAPKRQTRGRGSGTPTKRGGRASRGGKRDATPLKKTATGRPKRRRGANASGGDEVGEAESEDS